MSFCHEGFFKFKNVMIMMIIIIASKINHGPENLERAPREVNRFDTEDIWGE